MKTTLAQGLEDTELAQVDLSAADLRFAHVDAGTVFDRCKVQGCIIDRRTLESLDDYGKLTKGDRMLMVIIDDVATLRRSFSGFWQWVHLLSMIAFLAPYAWFLAQQRLGARFRPASDETIALWTALLRYVVNGGTGWREGWDPAVWPISLFVFLLGYPQGRCGHGGTFLLASLSQDATKLDHPHTVLSAVCSTPKRP